MPFVYRERSQAAIHDRANRQGGDFQGYIKDEFKIYKPRDGENCIRILPATWDSDHYGMNVHVHWGVGPENASVLCLRKMRGERCPVCEEVTALERIGDTETAKDMGERLSVLTWILDRKDEAAGPQLWGMPFTKVDLEIQKQSQDRQSGVYFVVDNPYEGYDIYFDKSGKQRNTDYKGVQLARNPTSVDQIYLDYIAEVPVPDTLIWRDYDTIKNLLYGGVPPETIAPPARFAGNGQAAPAPRPAMAPPGVRRVAPPPVAAARPVGPPPRRVATPVAPPPMQRPVPRAVPPVVEEQYDPDPVYDDPNAGYDPNAYDDQPYEPPPQQTSAPPMRQVPPRPMAPPSSGNVTPADRAADIRNRFGRR